MTDEERITLSYCLRSSSGPTNTLPTLLVANLFSGITLETWNCGIVGSWLMGS